MKTRSLLLLCAACTAVAFAQPPNNANRIGLFEDHGDIGAVLHKGSSEYDAAVNKYTLTGSGENVWATSDAMQFAWRRVAGGDVTMSAEIAFANSGGEHHKKAMLMIRQSLDPDSAYVDAVLHGNGLVSLQMRDAKGAVTHQIEETSTGAKRLSIRKIGSYFVLMLSNSAEELRPAGGAFRLVLQEPFYVGIGVCAHNKDASETATFRNMELSVRTPKLYSTLETMSVPGGDRQVVYVVDSRIEAPNWTHDGKWLLFNGNGRLQKISPDPAAGAKPEMVDTGFANRLNNDHGLSPDGAMLAFSDNSQEDKHSLVYTMPLSGGTPKRITKESPSYWHGWSPDGKTLVYAAVRNNDFDVFSISADGGEEKRLTSTPGTDDGPEFTPDGKYIYFNSERTGHMQIWRMKPDGSEQEQVTNDEYNNWFPHFSPDGKTLVMLSYEPEVTGHPENKDVLLRLMNVNDKKITVLTRLFGGQGTINVPSWSPDGKRIAFVSYQLIP